MTGIPYNCFEKCDMKHCFNSAEFEFSYQIKYLYHCWQKWFRVYVCMCMVMY